MKRLELMIGRVLFICVLFSIMVTLVGAIIYGSHHAREVINFSVAGMPQNLPFDELLVQVWHGNGLSIIQLGLILMIVSQVIRVLLTALVFVKQRDLAFMIISLLVLLLMSYQLV